MDFLDSIGAWIYLVIFGGRMLETFVSILWVILVSRGERFASTLVMGIATTLWITVTGTVIVGFQDDIWKSIIYVLSTAIGTYIGTIIEEKLALGLSSLQVIIPQDNMVGDNSSLSLAKILRKKGFAVTVMHGKGKLGLRDILMLHLKRRRISEAVKIIRKQEEDAVIIVNDIRSMTGGYLTSR